MTHVSFCGERSHGLKVAKVMAIFLEIVPISLDKKLGEGGPVERVAIRKRACAAVQRRRALFGGETTRIASCTLKACERGAEGVEKNAC